MQQLKVEVWAGKDLLSVDRRLFEKDSCDPYLKLAFGDMELRSRTHKNTLTPGTDCSPAFHEAFFLPVAEPAFITHLSLQLLDFEKLGAHQPLGSCRVPLQLIREGSLSKPYWQNFYGAPLKADSRPVRDKMNLFPDLGTRHSPASSYNGALLTRMTLVDEEKPSFCKKDIPYSEQKPPLPSKTFHLLVDVLAVFGFTAKKDLQFSLAVTCGSASKTLKGLVYNRGVLQVNERVDLKVPSCNSIADCPDLICSLEADSVGFAFLRFKARDLYLKQNKDFANLKLEVNEAFDHGLKYHESGFVRLRALLADRDLGAELPRPNKNPSRQQVAMVVNLFSARGLPSADENGLADPEAVCYHLGSVCKSRLIRKSVDPIWNDRLLVNTWVTDNYSYPLLVTVFDRDEAVLKDKREFLGLALVETPFDLQAKQQVNEVTAPKWHSLSNNGGVKMGRILLSVQHLAPIPPSQDPYSKTIKRLSRQKAKFKLKIYILGLRNLQSGSLFEVKKPRITFNLGSLKEGYSSTFGDLLTANCKSGGPNANFNSVIA